MKAFRVFRQEVTRVEYLVKFEDDSATETDAVIAVAEGVAAPQGAVVVHVDPLEDYRVIDATEEVLLYGA